MNTFSIIRQLKIVRIALLIALIGIVLIIGLGFHIEKTRKIIQETRSVAAAGKNVQQNFEENLRSYQKTHQKIITAISKVRPLKEEVIIPFVNSLEIAAQEMKLEIDIQNLEIGKEETQEETASFIKYRLAFNASYLQVIEYLKKIEEFPYMIKIESFSNKRAAAESIDERKNTEIIVKLYVQENTETSTEKATN